MKEILSVMAKPSIPLEIPRKRGVPEVEDPTIPKKLPVPVEPVKTAPQVPVPAGR